MVGKNAAWRRWCCERTPAAQQALRAKRLHFHHLVRKKKAIFWHTWLQSQEHATQSNPCIAARNIRRQLGTSRHSVPRCMRSASPECNYVEGEACLEAWRCHFRDVPASAVPGPRESGVDAQISVGCVNKRLVRPAGWIIRSLNPNLCKFFKNCLEESAGARKRTFCAFVDVRKAFDVAWRDAVKVRLADLGVTGSIWKVLDDLLTDTSARVAVNGSMSQPWSETAGVRQGSVLGPLLFNILFDSISAAVRAACPGVALGGSGSLRLTLLLYADDLVVLAENPRDLQRALDAIEAWGSSWRFSVGIGPEKTAVLVVGCKGAQFSLPPARR
ncbi:unnamed protein product [Symbiodinium natans]|uniref:Reverse transcriptase domain-containing protein n=1 Tax=Symbiodinium natans TaxID=878477 RepID=A0A812LAZ6_9DINO|nr:unnamed protein product [Symbiodinium natans]